MKHFITKLLLFLLLAMTGTAKGQGYQSYFDADSIRLSVCEFGTDHIFTFPLMINTSDIVDINGQSYYQGFVSEYYSGCYYGDVLYFREDTVTGRLYRYVPMLDKELLLSDMSLAVGDTIPFFPNRLAVVDGVSYEDGRKVIHISINAFYYDYYMEFHEGVFPDIVPLGLTEPSFYYWDCSSYLLCEYKDGEQVFISPRYNTCYIPNYFSVQEERQHRILVYPTNIHSTESIHIKTPETILETALLDLLGREVPVICNQESPCHWCMNVSGGVSGVYVVRTTTKEGTSYEKIFINN